LCRRSTLGGKAGGFDLDPGSQLHDVEHLAQGRTFVEVDAKRASHVTSSKSAAPCRITTRRSARSAATASRITVRLTPVAAIISCSVGNREPGGSLPLMISAVRRATNSAVRRRGASSGCSSASLFGNGLVKGLTSSRNVKSSYDLMNNTHGVFNQSAAPASPHDLGGMNS
jgi:hypothetical protein